MKKLIANVKEHIEQHFPRKRIFATLAILVLALGLVKITSLGTNTEKREVVSDTDSALAPSDEVKTSCFFRDQKATNDAPYAVEEHIKLAITAGSVTGTKTGTQSGPDMTNGYEGTLAGNVIDGEMNLLFLYTIEGSDQQELEVYEFRDQWLMKKRWLLVEKNHVLVPTRIGDPDIIVYKPEVCA